MVKTIKEKVSLPNFKNKIMLAGIAVIAFILTLLLIIGFIYNERNTQRKATINLLSNETNRDAVIVRNLFDSYIETLRSLSVYIQRFDDLESAETIGFLRLVAGSFGFERLLLSFPDGRSYTTDGLTLNITQDDFLEPIRSGQVFISDLITSEIDGEPIVYIQVPMYRNGTQEASLGYFLTRDNLNSQLHTFLSEEGKYFYIIDEQGQYVGFDSRGNPLFIPEVSYFDSLDMFTYGKGFSKELIMEAFAEGKSEQTEFSLEGTHRYGYYSPIGINKWMLEVIVSKNAIDADTNKFLARAMILAAQILLIFLAVAFLVYREQKIAREKAQLDEQCFRILAEHTSKAVMEWDYGKKIMYFPNHENIAGHRELLNNGGLRTSDEAINAGEVYPDDCDIYRKLFSNVADGKSMKNVRLRFREVDGSYPYCSFSSTVVYDKKRKPYKSIGFIENIDEQVRRENVLLQKANTDPLTGFYNKAAAETFVSEIMLSSSNGALHALMCIDLDNFKSINDLFGHLYGDDVLKEVASIMKNLFRSDDVLGRFGGDEFVIFVRAIPNIDFVKEKAAELNRRLNKTYERDGVKCTISASIGIAVFPSDGTAYSVLHQKADEASYTAKKSGKNTYRFAAAPE